MLRSLVGSEMCIRDSFDTADLMKWCSNRLNACADKKRRKAIEKVVTQDSIEEAVNSCMVHDHENTGHLTYEVFRGGMCDFTSKMREVVLTMLNTFDKLEDWEYLEKVSGELTTQEYIVMYHRHLQQVAKACRKQLHQDDDEDVFITNKKQVIQAKLNGVEKEVEGLLKKFEEYNARLRGLEPSLRARNHDAVDDTFDLLVSTRPADRWDNANPRRSWAH
eukprot:TRINITY_DN8035_c0_g1_i1.p1 TRINITY_DN8035_c0_g1~~TRINITY_DN8035_c0_g1_i1.p1  ORF type:complete len:235 (-),score=110.09 TRINITY_DN8035_c0_g1_i1:169-828(-)